MKTKLVTYIVKELGNIDENSPLEYLKENKKQ